MKLRVGIRRAVIQYQSIEVDMVDIIEFAREKDITDIDEAYQGYAEENGGIDTTYSDCDDYYEAVNVSSSVPEDFELCYANYPKYQEQPKDDPGQSWWLQHPSKIRPSELPDVVELWNKLMLLA